MPTEKPADETPAPAPAPAPEPPPAPAPIVPVEIEPHEVPDPFAAITDLLNKQHAETTRRLDLLERKGTDDKHETTPRTPAQVPDPAQPVEPAPTAGGGTKPEPKPKRGKLRLFRTF